MESTARIYMDGDHQAVALPDDFRFDGNEVKISKDPATGDVILSSRPSSNFDEFFHMLDKMTQEERDEFVVPERDKTPMRVPDLG